MSALDNHLLQISEKESRQGVEHSLCTGDAERLLEDSPSQLDRYVVKQEI